MWVFNTTNVTISNPIYVFSPTKYVHTYTDVPVC